MSPGTLCSHINESQLQTYESRTLFLMTSLQYHCILGLAEIKTLHPRDKDAGCAGKKSLETFILSFFEWPLKTGFTVVERETIDSDRTVQNQKSLMGILLVAKGPTFFFQTLIRL